MSLHGRTCGSLRALFKSLKHYCRPEGRRITRESGGKRLDKTLFTSLFSKAWLKAATPSKTQAGFRASGIYPFNPAKINEDHFMPSQTSERSFQETPEDPEPATRCHAPPDAGEDEDFCHLQCGRRSRPLSTLCMTLCSQQSQSLSTLCHVLLCPPLQSLHLWQRWQRSLKW